MTDLIAFLDARLDEDERDARYATPGPWHIPENDPLAYCVDSPDGSGRICRFGDRVRSDDVRNSLHIVRHDPARILREVEADRRLLAAYAEVAHMDIPDPEPEFAYGRAVGLGEAVRLRAANWSDHPDYQPEWEVSQ